MKRRQGKQFSETTGKLHILCPHSDKSGVTIPVVIKGGYCYRSGQCMVLECKYHSVQTSLEDILSITW